jgi:hypothetical protein
VPTYMARSAGSRTSVFIAFGKRMVVINDRVDTSQI